MSEIKSENNDSKKIIINECINVKNKNNNNNTKFINYEKEKKMRVETKTWGLTENELLHETQIKSLLFLKNILDSEEELDSMNGSIEILKNGDIISLIKSHIKHKIYGYKQQDIIKKKLDITKLVGFKEVIDLLINCDMKCYYCAQETYILYERVREMKQWSLDRINNDIGHIRGNVVVACLECNLKRRRTNKDAFMFTKNLVITREGI